MSLGRINGLIFGLTLAVAALASSAPVMAQASPPPMEGIKIDGEYGFGLPPDVSAHGYQIDRLINILHIFMAVLFVGWGIFFVTCLCKYRGRPGHAAQYGLIQAKPSKYVEVAVLLVEIVLLIGFSMPVWANIKNDLPQASDNPVRIRVIAEQFAWNFHYSGADGKFGRTAPKFIDTALNPAGLDRENDPNAKDDVVTGEFHFPVNVPVICDLASKDVIHSFSLPVMRIKQDVIPGMRIPVWFKAVKEGTYEVACAQLCGNNHYKMKAIMVIESAEKFAAWLTKKATVEEFEE
jgi:cytochrome c oxidase subunit 2